MIENFIPASEFAQRLGYSPRSYNKLEKLGGIYIALRGATGRPRYHREQVRLADLVEIGAITPAEAAQQWEQFRRAMAVQPIAALPRRKSHAQA